MKGIIAIIIMHSLTSLNDASVSILEILYFNSHQSIYKLLFLTLDVPSQKGPGRGGALSH
jgi:hypothetical protein